MYGIDIRVRLVMSGFTARSRKLAQHSEGTDTVRESEGDSLTRSS